MFELIPLIGGGIFGAVVKLFAMSMENKKRQNEMLISTIQAKSKTVAEVNEVAANNPFFAWTRRVIALSLTAMIGALIFLPYLNPNIPVNVIANATEGGSYLFGLIDTKVTQQTWIQLKGVVFHPVVGDAFLAVIGCYFGQSAASAK